MTHAHDGSGIHWFDGSVDDAFKRAAERHRPLYLYWGAIWCPPCQEIKNTVFKSSAFLGLSNLFVPVYIDGDSARAQEIGERFGVKGYPTMIVFDSAGKEVTRIPGGIEIERYTQVLELALNHLQPVSDLVQRALDNPKQLSGADFTQLAFYSWGQDNGVIPEGRATEVFAKLALASRDYPVAGARLFLQWLVAITEEDDEAVLPEEQAADIRDRLREILGDDKVALASWEHLTYYSVPLVKLVGAGEGGDKALRDLWSERTVALRKAPSLSTADHLGGWLPTAELLFALDPEGRLPPATVAGIESDVEWADGITQSPYARQSVIYVAASLLESAHLYDQAETLLRAELARSESPYYFMSDLAYIAEEQGKNDEAVNWLEQAYLAAEGPATRLQWGASYVRGLIRLQPQKRERVAEQSVNLLGVIEDDSELFSGRNYRVLKRLMEALDKWRESVGKTPTLESFYAQLAQRCAEVDPKSQPGMNCHELTSV